MSAWFDYWLNNIDELQKINWLAPKEAKKSQRFNRGAGFFFSLNHRFFYLHLSYGFFKCTWQAPIYGNVVKVARSCLQFVIRITSVIRIWRAKNTQKCTSIEQKRNASMWDITLTSRKLKETFFIWIERVDRLICVLTLHGFCVCSRELWICFQSCVRKFIYWEFALR